MPPPLPSSTSTASYPREAAACWERGAGVGALGFVSARARVAQQLSGPGFSEQAVFPSTLSASSTGVFTCMGWRCGGVCMSTCRTVHKVCAHLCVHPRVLGVYWGMCVSEGWGWQGCVWNCAQQDRGRSIIPGVAPHRAAPFPVPALCASPLSEQHLNGIALLLLGTAAGAVAKSIPGGVPSPSIT